MVRLSDIREYHVLMFAVQVAIGIFAGATGFIDVAYEQYLCGGLGLAAMPVLFYFAYRHHRTLRAM